jgi:hypothetical protein
LADAVRATCGEVPTGGDLPVEPIDAMYTHLARWVNSALERLGLA